jgi:hypothetical protein
VGCGALHVRASFADQGTVNNELGNDANVLSYYNVARGYTTTMFDPLTPVLNVQDISFVTRAMVTKGFWIQESREDGTMYPNVPANSGHRLDLATWVKYVGLVPGTTSLTPTGTRTTRMRPAPSLPRRSTWR